MMQKKTFARRPWNLEDNGLIKHFDGIQIEGASERAFHLCLHTSQSFLTQSNVECVLPRGFVWPQLILENFKIDNLVSGKEAVYITDGAAPDGVKFNLTLKNGKLSNLGLPAKVKFATFSYLELDILCLNNITILGGIYDLDLANCDINQLIVVNCDGFKINGASGIKIGSLELWNSPNVHVDPSMLVTPTIKKGAVVENIKAALAATIMIEGVLYNAQANGLALTPQA